MPMPANPTSRIAIADVDKRLVSGLSTHPGQTSRFRGRTVRDHRILILHDGPPPVALHYYEGPDVPLVFVLNAIGCCESCHPAGTVTTAAFASANLTSMCSMLSETPFRKVECTSFNSRDVASLP